MATEKARFKSDRPLEKADIASQGDPLLLKFMESAPVVGDRRSHPGASSSKTE